MPDSPAPVPVEWCLGGRDLTEPRLSPAASTVAMVVRWQRASAIVLVDAHGGPERLLTTSPAPSPGRGLGGGCFDWLPDGGGVVYVAEDGEVWQQPLAAGPTRSTAFERSCRAPVATTDGAVVVVLDEAEVWRVPAHGSPTRLDDGTDEFCFDPAVSRDGRTVSWIGWSPPSMPWDAAVVVTVQLDDAGRAGVPERWAPPGGSVQQPGVLPDGRRTCVHDGSGWLNVHVDGRPVAAEAAEQAGPTWGMGNRSYAVAPDGRRVAFTRNERGHGRLCVAEIASGRVEDVARGVHGRLDWVGDRLVALRSGARTPTSVVAYDTTGTDPTLWPRTVLAVGPVDGWRRIPLPEPELVTTEHDGVTLHARRYAADAGRLLVWVHGGPTDQWQVDFRPRIAYWWSRGWDVLVVDPRGTTGHGRDHQRALNGRWGRLDVDDTAAMIRDAHARGWASPARTVIIGGSSGGMTVLGLLADHGDLVAGGVASYPVSDLAALATVTHRFEAHYTDTLVAPSTDPATDERFRALSPLYRADRIRGPLLVFHGTDDPVVPLGQTEALVEAVRAAGGVVDDVVYDGEGHGFRDPANQRDEYARTERFLEAVVTAG